MSLFTCLTRSTTNQRAKLVCCKARDVPAFFPDSESDVNFLDSAVISVPTYVPLAFIWPLETKADLEAAFVGDANILSDFGTTATAGFELTPEFADVELVEFHSVAPVPLPAAAWLFLSAIAGLGLSRRSAS